jgi:hypothetical protein
MGAAFSNQAGQIGVKDLVAQQIGGKVLVAQARMEVVKNVAACVAN